MSIILIHYSDLHLEFGEPFTLPDTRADLLILSGDVITFKDYTPLAKLLGNWTKPVLFVAGNHEYYTNTPMEVENKKFKEWLAQHFPNVTFLQDEYITINGVNFFGGTMWTNFRNSDVEAMAYAYSRMNDYRQIMIDEKTSLYPDYTVELHNKFVAKLLDWFAMDLEGRRVVITHHCPIIFKDSQYHDSGFAPAYNSLDMIPIIKKYQPSFWIHGHTHECLFQKVGATIIKSNQRGYKILQDRFQCENFDEDGALTGIVSDKLFTIIE